MQTRKSCRICRSKILGRRRKYCSDECAGKSRRVRRPPKRTCRWCQTPFRPTRKGHRFCKPACRSAHFRKGRPSVVELLLASDLKRIGLPYWPRVPAPSWTELHFDAKRCRETWVGAFIAFRHVEGWDDAEILIKESAKLTAPYSGPTSEEGVAAVHALRWASEQVPQGETLVVVSDNQAVVSQLRSSHRGEFGRIWREITRLMETVGQGRHVEIMRGSNQASRLANLSTVKSERIWDVPPELKLVK